MGGHDVEYAFLDLFGKSFNHSWDTTSWGLAPHIGMLWEILDGWKIRLEGGGTGVIPVLLWIMARHWHINGGPFPRTWI